MKILFITDNVTYVMPHVKRLITAGNSVWLESNYSDAEKILKREDIDKIIITDYVPCKSEDPMYKKGHEEGIPTVETFLEKNEELLTGIPIAFLYFNPGNIESEGVTYVDAMSVSDTRDFLSLIERL